MHTCTNRRCPALVKGHKFCASCQKTRDQTLAKVREIYAKEGEGEDEEYRFVLPNSI